MKKMLLSLVAALILPLAAYAMSYEEAREQALFLTDKMAYELNLNSEQYEYCYEINLDYLMGVETADDVYGSYLTYRNADLRHILFDWQYAIFAATDYFFHPLIWHRGVWSLPIYRHYAYGHFFYDRPLVYLHYRGGHGRTFYGGGYYGGRRPHWKGGFRGHDRGAIAHRGDFNRRGGHAATRDGRIMGGRGSGHADTRGSMNNGRGSINNGRGSMNYGRNDNGHLSGQDNSRVMNNRSGSFGNTRSSGTVSENHPSIGQANHSVSSGPSASNDARPGSFSRGNSTYSHPSSTRSIGSSGATRSISSHSGGMRNSSPSMSSSRPNSMGGGSRGGSMGGSHGGGHGRGR
ncbi:MAG: hypothetical protein IJ209_08560 [Bacteroidaceae bacterium]|nr:hypothetical protein [Bacteroidaceae bacterium]